MQSNHCSYGPTPCIDRLCFTSHEITARQELVAGCDTLALGLLPVEDRQGIGPLDNRAASKHGGECLEQMPAADHALPPGCIPLMDVL
jgi:hypothetical protein